jgi:Saxitoxin biosynthesis operon protein SxtJ
MMQKQLFEPNDRTLRQFAGIWIVFFGAIALRQQFQHHRPVIAMVVAAAALGVGLTGLVWPGRIRPVFVGWMKAAYPIGWVVSRIVLSVIFYGVFTPLALVFRLLRRDALSLESRPAAITYWHSKPSSADKARYLRQY